MTDEYSPLSVYHLDANRVNARQKDEFVNQLERWHDQQIIHLEYSLDAYKEAEIDNPAREAKAAEYTWVGAVDNLGDEKCRLEVIANIVFPAGPKTDSERNDVRILYTAWKAGATLITEDGNSKSQPRGILGSQSELARIGVKVLSSKDAVAEITREIQSVGAAANEI